MHLEEHEQTAGSLEKHISTCTFCIGNVSPWTKFRNVFKSSDLRVKDFLQYSKNPSKNIIIEHDSNRRGNVFSHVLTEQ